MSEASLAQPYFRSGHLFQSGFLAQEVGQGERDDLAVAPVEFYELLTGLGVRHGRQLHSRWTLQPSTKVEKISATPRG